MAEPQQRTRTGRKKLESNDANKYVVLNLVQLFYACVKMPTRVASGSDVMEAIQGWVGRKDRHCAAVDVTVVHQRCRLPVRLTNFSDDGCRIEAKADFRIGPAAGDRILQWAMSKRKSVGHWLERRGGKILAESDFGTHCREADDLDAMPHLAKTGWAMPIELSRRTLLAVKLPLA